MLRSSHGDHKYPSLQRFEQNHLSLFMIHAKHADKCTNFSLIDTYLENIDNTYNTFVLLTTCRALTYLLRDSTNMLQIINIRVGM